MSGTSLIRCLDLDRPLPRHAVAAAFGLLALGLRLLQAGTQPLWFDEALTMHIVHEPDGFRFVHNTAPLYFVLAKWWTGLFGLDAAGLRSLSALAGAAFVWLSFHVARDWFGNRAAVAAAALALVSPLHLYYSQEGRAYALLLLLLLASFAAMRSLARRASLPAAVLTWAAATAALYTHYLAAIPLCIGFAAFGLPRRDDGTRPGRRVFAATGAASLLALVPWLVWWTGHTAFSPADMEWISVVEHQVAGSWLIPTSLEMFQLGAQLDRAPIDLKQFTNMHFPEPLRFGALLATVGLMLHAVARLRQQARDAAQRQRIAGLQCLLLLFGPLLALWAVSLFRPIYIAARYDLIAYPAFVLLMGHAIDRAFAVRDRLGRTAAVLGVAVLAAALTWKDVRYFGAEAAPDSAREVAHHLAAHVGDGESVVLVGGVGLPVLARLYEDGFVWSQGRCSRPGREFGCRLLPVNLEPAPAAVSRYERALRDGSLVTDLRQLVAGATAPGIWLVLGVELRTARDAELDRVARSLFAVLAEAGYEMADFDAELGAAHLRRAR